ncbi:hypothetical protein [Streptomyces violaceusniger]|uniref:Uncharacterized protein n=1 Tax=Streptomyces violaceusniger (strain Tu 4113) TaxID=653045 RepID=G2P7D1_STRV4|nr:hypothetical protein [Streptomyces violaceusniger]AEM87091.1 hypothetical protein Strvi_7756 [Streptomyces violaceusniger Tu 4113]
MADRMTFVLEGRDRLSRVMDKAGDSANRLAKRLALVSAAVPAAAALAPLAAQAGAAGAAMAAFGAAVIPQIGALSDASEAQQKYQDAVAKSGARSEEAVKAQVAYQQQLAKMPPATKTAAAGLSQLKDEYRAWSDSLAKDTMPVFTKGLAIASASLPKMSGLVRGASTELNRFMTILAGGVASSGFDRVMDKFSDFATNSLKRANDALVHFLRTMNTGQIGGALSQFMADARANGPLLADTLKNVALAAIHLLDAAQGVGIGLLQIANAFASVVASLPTGFLTTLLQAAVAIKAIRLAGAGIQLVAGAFAALRPQIIAVSHAIIGANGPIRTMTAAFGALSSKAKFAVATTGIGLLALGLAKLSSLGREAPPNVDRLTTALGNLGRTGKNTGYSAEVFGSKFDKLRSTIDKVINPSVAESVNNWGHKWSGGLLKAGDATDKFNKVADSTDKALTNLVRGGKAELAAEALKSITKGMSSDELDKFKGKLNDYKSALADAKFEERLAAEAQGLFGTQAQKTQKALADQKASADGLRQSIQALNDVSRKAGGDMNAFEQGIDDMAAAAKKNAGALDMTNGKINLNSQAARDVDTAMRNAAAATDAAATSARENGASWEEVNGIYQRGRAELIKNAHAAGLGREAAKQYADSLLKIPKEKSTLIKMRAEDAIDGLNSVMAAIRRTPGSKSVTVKALTADAVKLLENLGYKVKRLPNGKFSVTANTGTAAARLAELKRLRDSIRSKSATITVTTHYRQVGKPPGHAGPGGIPAFARGGHVRGYAGGGELQAFPSGGLISGPGTGTSDSILAMFASGAMARVSNTEFIVRSAAVKKYGVAFLNALNAGRLNLKGLASGGMVGAGGDSARGLAAGLAGGVGAVATAARSMAAAVTRGVRDELEIASPSKKMQKLAKDAGAGLIKGLTGSKDQIASTSKALAKDIWDAFSGTKDNRLVAQLNKTTKRLQDLAAKRDALVKKIAEAKQFATDTTATAKSSAQLSSLGLDENEITAGSIKGALSDKLAKIKQFTRYIDMLAKRGLNKGLLRQILNMGPEAGYAYASALAGADNSTLKSISSIQSSIDTASTTLGTLGADRLYDAGKMASAGFLAGLRNDQKKIELLMMSIAKGMQKSIKRALGIKSPSTVMAEIGQYSTEGLARGLVDGLPAVQSAMDAVAGKVSSVQPVIGKAVPGGGTVVRAGGDTFHIHVDGTAENPDAMARRIHEALLRFKRNRGGAGLGLA